MKAVFMYIQESQIIVSPEPKIPSLELDTENKESTCLI
jgi:hypothetical protein